MIRSIPRFGLFLALALSHAASLPAAVVLGFGFLQDGEQVLNYYDGGYGSKGSTSNINYGVAFAAGAIASLDADFGGTGNFANAPSPFTVIFTTNGRVTANVSAGFEEALSFYYVAAALGNPGSVKVFDQLNGQGTQLASAVMNPVFKVCPGDPTGSILGCWQLVNLDFSGTAKSVVFDIASFQFGLDNLGFGTRQGDDIGGIIIAPVSAETPEPGTLVLMGGGIAAALLLRKRHSLTR